uniref:DDE Tnp4 domain-containing protein n=1 Tax=Scylla olivacea TaxID=85551 RepID=A0A0P4VTR6_SCYOL
MVVVNPNYEFLYVDVDSNGRVSDGEVWAHSTLFRRFEGGTTGLPDDDQLPGSHGTMPYVFVGDDTFPLKYDLIKLYPFKAQDDEQRIYYRLPRVRHIVENAFGIITSRFQILSCHTMGTKENGKT